MIGSSITFFSAWIYVCLRVFYKLFFFRCCLLVQFILSFFVWKTNPNKQTRRIRVEYIFCWLVGWLVCFSLSPSLSSRNMASSSSCYSKIYYLQLLANEKKQANGWLVGWLVVIVPIYLSFCILFPLFSQLVCNRISIYTTT